MIFNGLEIEKIIHSLEDTVAKIRLKGKLSELCDMFTK